MLALSHLNPTTAREGDVVNPTSPGFREMHQLQITDVNLLTNADLGLSFHRAIGDGPGGTLCLSGKGTNSI